MKLVTGTLCLCSLTSERDNNRIGHMVVSMKGIKMRKGTGLLTRMVNAQETFLLLIICVKGRGFWSMEERYRIEEYTYSLGCSSQHVLGIN